MAWLAAKVSLEEEASVCNHEQSKTIINAMTEWTYSEKYSALVWNGGVIQFPIDWGKLQWNQLVNPIPDENFDSLPKVNYYLI